MIARILFALKYKTMKPVVVDPNDKDWVIACANGETTRLKRRCSHQGAPLEHGYIDKGDLVCNWHGCRFKVSGKRRAE